MQWPGTLTFAPGQTSLNVVVNVVASALSRPTKTFRVQLSNSTNATLQTAQGTGSILNDIGASSIADVSGALSATASTNFAFTVSLANPVAVPVTVEVSTANGTAVAGVDYQGVTSLLVSFAGQTTGTVTVVVNSNPNPGLTLNFTVNLSNPTNGYLTDGQALGTILNQNLQSFLNLSASQYSAKETDAGATITILRSGDLTRKVAVQFTAGGGSSSPPSEYQPLSQTVTFNPGDTVKTVVVHLMDDHQFDQNETVQLTLSNPSVGGSLGSTSTATLTIKDEDGTPDQHYVYYTYVSLLQRGRTPTG